MDIRSGTAVSGDVKLYYEDMGDLDHPPVLLIMGLGAQMLLWRTDFCARLVAKGLRVIRYDNRDVGLSTKTERHRPGQPLATRLVRSWLGLPSQAAYTLEDMAADAAALLDHLDVKHAHVVGASMGGMIAQIFAARFAQRTKTLAVIFSSNNHRFLPPPAPRALLALLTFRRRIRHATSLSTTPSGSARSSAARPTRFPKTRYEPRPPKATTATSIPGESPSSSARYWAAAACCATTGASSHRPSSSTGARTS